MRDLINLMDAMEKGCPPATQSIDLNLKNRKKAIDEYKALYKKHYGEELSDKDASELASSLINLFRMIYRPIGKSKKST